MNQKELSKTFMMISNGKTLRSHGLYRRRVNPFKPEFTIVIFIHYKPQIAVAILVVDEDDLQWVKDSRKLPRIGNRFSWKFSF